MNRFFAYLLGPELSWLLLYAATTLLVRRNHPPTPQASAMLETIGWFLPPAGIAASFVTLLWQPGNKWLWLLRTGLVGLVGITCLVQHFVGKGFAPDPGIGTYGILLLALGNALLLTGLVLIALLF
jgi:hypothetical protein